MNSLKDILIRIFQIDTWRLKWKGILTKGTISYDFYNHIVRKESLTDSNDKYSIIESKLIDLFQEDTRNKPEPYQIIYFKNSKARITYGNEESPTKFGYYDLNELVYYSPKIEDGQLITSPTSMNFRCNPDWEVKYTVEQFPEQVKEIANFMCYKTIVTEHKWIKGKLKEYIYELFVTDQINFPPHLICGWYDHVIQACALEVKMWQKNKEESYTWFKARSIESKTPRRIFSDFNKVKKAVPKPYHEAKLPKTRYSDPRPIQ